METTKHGHIQQIKTGSTRRVRRCTLRLNTTNSEVKDTHISIREETATKLALASGPSSKLENSRVDSSTRVSKAASSRVKAIKTSRTNRAASLQE
jgi:hypothetical protein